MDYKDLNLDAIENLEIKRLPPLDSPGPITEIKNLPIGARIEFVGLEDLYKDVYITRISGGSATIKGSIRNSDKDEFTPIKCNYMITLTSKVRQV